MKNKGLKILSASLLASLLMLNSCTGSGDDFSKRTDGTSTDVSLPDTEYTKISSPYSISFDDETLTLSWNAVTGATSYDINVNGITIKTDVTSTTFVIPSEFVNLIENLVFSVRAKNKDSISNYFSYLYDVESFTSTSLFLSSTNLDNTVNILGVNPQSSIKIDEELVIPATVAGKVVSSISINAFNGLKSFKKVVLPTSIVNIGEGAFSNTNLEEINLQDCTNLTTIEANAFSKTSKLKEVTLPKSLKTISDNAFSGCGVTTLNLDLDSNLETIGNSAFESTKITQFTFPSSLKSIGNKAFASSNVKNVDYSSNSKLETIGDMAFASTSDLISLRVPSNVKYLGNNAFEGSKIKYLYIEQDSKLEYIGSDLFKNNKNITYIGRYYEVLPEVFTLNIPSSVKEIGNYAFDSIKFDELVLPVNSKLEIIGQGAFMNNTKVSVVSIPDSVKIIKADAFKNNTHLETINFKDSSSIAFIDSTAFESTKYVSSLTTKGEEIRFVNVLYKASKDDLKAENVVMDNSIISISNKAYEGAKCKYITFSNNLKYIGQGAFANCEELTEIVLPTTLEQIDASAFENCSKLAIISFNSTKGLTTINDRAFANTTSLKSIILPEGLKVIGQSCFESSAIESITLPSSLNTINDSSFENCTSLKSITIPNAISYLGHKAFKNASSLSSVNFEDNALTNATYKAILSETFADCISLNTIDLPNCIENIEENAFANCSSLTNITCLSQSLLIDNNAFVNSKFENDSVGGLVIFNEVLVKYIGNDVNVTLTDGIKVISEHAFSNSNVETISLPSSITSIEEYAFANCLNLKSVSINENASLKSIGSHAFDGNINLTSFEMPNNIESISSYAFYRCVNLKNIDLNKDKLTFIDEYSFAACNSIESITLSNNVTEIAQYAFYKCNIKNIKLPTNLISVGDYAFAYNGKSDNNLVDPENWIITPSIDSLTLNDSITYIGKYAFANNNLISLDLPTHNKLTLKEYCFINSSNLTEFASGENLVIEQGVLNGANKISKLEISSDVSINNLFGGYVTMVPSSLTEIDIIGDCEVIADSHFAGLGNLEIVRLPSGVKEIGNNAFYGCARLVEVTNINEVKTIGNSAFYGCNNFDFDNTNTFTNVNYVGYNAFSGTKFMVSSTEEFVMINNVLVKYNGKSKKVVLPENVVSIAGGTFSANLSLEELTLSENTKLICTGAFDSCSNLELITIQGSTFVEIEINVFDTISNKFEVVLDEDLISIYKGDIYWSLCEGHLIGK